MRAHERFEIVQDVQKTNDHSGVVGGVVGGDDEDDHRPDGFIVTRSCICVTAVMITFLLCAAILLTYNFGKCSDINVQSEVCDKKNVIPIKIALNTTQSTDADGDAVKTVQFEEDLNRNNRTNKRLPDTMHPLHYELKLMPFLMAGNFTFNGHARITLNVTKSCQNITLHAMALKIGKISVWQLIGNEKQTNATQTQTELKVTRIYLREIDQLFVVILDEVLQPNNLYEVHIKYTGVLNDMLQGFYRSSYEVKNQTR